MYCFSNQVYSYLDPVEASARGEYEITDAVQMMIADGLRCRAVELTGYWKDLATPGDITAAEQMMEKRTIARVPLHTS
jgi:glucose-1-phosphate thymidylyltransferase